MIRFRSTKRYHLRVAIVALLLCLHVPVAAQQPIGLFELTSGWATFGIAVPRGAARDALQVGSLPTQTDVKTRWPDGSIRFAVVTARARSKAAHRIVPATVPAGVPLRPQWPTSSVAFVIAGRRYVADLPAFTGADAWLAGPLVNESRVMVSPRAGGEVHPLLQVIFDVRSYAEGGHRVDVTVQSVKDVAAADSVRYDVTVNLGGNVVFTKANVTHSAQTRWRKVFTTGGFTEASVTPDISPFVASGAVPRFLASVENATYDVEGSRFDILGWGTMAPYMGEAGGRAEIGLFPEWTVQYLVHASASQRALMLRHADLSGSWSGHITEPDGATLISIDTYPNYMWHGNVTGRPNGLESLKGTTQALENAHVPSLTYVPYLMTGDRYYLDQTKLWANFSLLATGHDPFAPRNSTGIMFTNEVRGFAWGLRNVAHAALISPDNDPAKAYFTEKLQNNLDWLENYATNLKTGPFESLFPGRFGSDTGNWTPPYKVIYAPWQMAYFGVVLEHIGEMGYGPVDAMRNRIARVWLRQFTEMPDNDRARDDRVYSAPYHLYVGHVTRERPDVINFYQTVGEVFAQTYGNPPPADGRGINPFVGYYGNLAHAMLTIATRLNLPGARQSLEWLRSQPGVADDVNARCGFALALESRGSAPPVNVRIVR